MRFGSISGRLIGSFVEKLTTRLVICNALILTCMLGLAVPIGSKLVIFLVNSRVEENIRKTNELFQESIKPITSSSQALTGEQIKPVLNRFLHQRLPEDDTFLISIIDSNFHASNPVSLPAQFQPGSTLMRRWATTKTALSGQVETTDPDIGSIIYSANPILSRGQVIGVFVVALTTAGELSEAADVIRTLTWLLTGTFFVALALTWIAIAILLAPLRELASTMNLIRGSNLDERLTVRGHGELAAISTSFNNMLDRIQALVASQREFIRDTGHELRTPLTIIGGHIELLDNEDKESRRATVSLVLEEVDRMSRLVSELTLLARVDRPEFLSKQSVDMKVFLERIFVKAKKLADRQWRLSEVASVSLEADEQRLSQGLLNLVLNATQHTHANQTIELGSKLDGKGNLQIWVADNGDGISADLQPIVFQRFTRGPHRPGSTHQGSGLGLSIVKAIAEAHNGGVELQSTPGEGSRFTLCIPT